MRKLLFKNYLWLLIVLFALSLIAGCGAAPPAAVPSEPPEEAPPAAPEDPRTPVAGAITMSDGRKVNGFASGKIGDELTNVFFSFRIDKAGLAEEFEGQKADRGFVYLIAEATVKNAFDGPVPMWADDFIAQWGDGDNDYCYPMDKVSDDQMDEEFSLAEGESVTKILVYEVPLPESGNDYGISYLEYYQDDVKGNLFMVNFKLRLENEG